MPTNAVPADGLPGPERFRAMITLGIAVAMSVLDSAIANIALPTIAQELHADPATSIWVVNAYQLAVTASLLPLASLGDIVGYRRVYWWGLLVFTVASAGCAAAQSLPVLVVARVLQGFGGAGIMSVNTALVRFVFPRVMLGRGIGTIAFVVATSAATGPTVAAAILSVASWHWLFAVNILPGILALYLAARVLPDTPRGRHRFELRRPSHAVHSDPRPRTAASPAPGMPPPEERSRGGRSGRVRRLRWPAWMHSSKSAACVNASGRRSRWTA